jgi:hypothetical protein
MSTEVADILERIRKLPDERLPELVKELQGDGRWMQASFREVQQRLGALAKERGIGDAEIDAMCAKVRYGR